MKPMQTFSKNPLARLSAIFSILTTVLLVEVGKTTLIAQDGNTMLYIHGHPDDEGIFGGGLLPYYSQVANTNVISLGMVTRNPNGSNPLQGSSGENRIEELKNAIRVYSGDSTFSTNSYGHEVAGNITLVEGGYIGTGCCDPDPVDTWSDSGDGFGWGSSIGVTNVTPGFGNIYGLSDARFAAAYGIAREIRRYRPQVVVTPHDLEGDYGHSVHSATAIAAIDAFTLAADSSVDIDGLAAFQTQKLYLRGDANDNRNTISWDGFTSTGGISSLFHDGFEDQTINGLSPREVTNLGLQEHASQGFHRVETVFIDNQNFEGNHSEWWTLYASTVGADTLEATFTVPGDVTGRQYQGFARGNFFQNVTAVPEPTGTAFVFLTMTGLSLFHRRRRKLL